MIPAMQIFSVSSNSTIASADLSWAIANELLLKEDASPQESSLVLPHAPKPESKL